MLAQATQPNMICEGLSTTLGNISLPFPSFALHSLLRTCFLTSANSQMFAPAKNLRRFLVCLLSVTSLASTAQAQRRAGEPLSAERVRRAIKQGSDYLLAELPKTQREMGNMQGGVTALCTLALLNAGVPASHPKIQESLRFLRKLPQDKTYVVSLQTMVFAAAQPRRDLPLIQENVHWLEQTQIKEGERAGSWTYPVAGRVGGASSDNSNSQFAVLALHEAERVGARVDFETWQMAAEYWKDCQRPDGSWSYQKGRAGSGSMTCAGIGATVICSGKVAADAAKVEDGFVQCCLPAEEDDSLERALKWLGRNFSVARNPGARNMSHTWHYYYLYGLERVGRLTARRFIGEHDWYREGAELLLAQQDKFSHRWVGSGFSEDDPHIATAYALLFLSKGRRPVLMAKLQFDAEAADGRLLTDDWKNHRSDVANLTAYTEKLWDLDLTWQIMDPQSATVDDLLQAPVLFASGSRSPLLDESATKIRDYLDRGGFLFAEACCADGGPFEKGFRQFLDQVFPEQEYELRRAGPEHILWRIEELVRPDSSYVTRLWTVEYGCRTCVVFSEADLSCYWELRADQRRRNLAEIVQRRIDDATSIGVNVLAYATNRQPKGKEAAFTGAETPDLTALGERGVIRVAKLQHGGGCNDAPGALVNLLRAAGQGELKLRVDASEFSIHASDPSLPRFHMAFMHGRHDFRFTPAEREALRDYLNFGGTLLADSICASEEFVKAFRREIALVLPEAPLQRIPIEHPIFTERAGGFDIREVQRRDPAIQSADQPVRSRVQRVPPELEGVEINGRLAVIFSPFDISCALEKHEALQCRGYTQRDAARIGLNVLMYSLTPDAGE